MSRKTRNNDWDDGSTVAPMDVDGMQGEPSALPGMSPRIQGELRSPGYSRRVRRSEALTVDPTITARETWKIILNAIGATLLIAAVFGVAGWLFIMFCIHVWLK